MSRKIVFWFDRLVFLPLIAWGLGAHPALTQASVVTRSLAADSAGPITLNAQTQPVDWVFRDEKVFPGPDESSQSHVTESAPATFHIQIVSVPTGKVIETFPLTPDAAQLSFTGRSLTTLAPGVYEVRLLSALPTRKWLGFLAWDIVTGFAVGSEKKTGPRTWPLIVLPTTSPNTGEANAEIKKDEPDTLRSVLIRWNSSNEREADDHDDLNALAPSTSPSTSLSSNPSDRSRLTDGALAPLAWIRGNGSAESSSPAQTWATRLGQIDQRLDRIFELAPDGVLLHSLATKSGSDNTLAVEQQYVVAKCGELGLPVWRFAPETSPESQTLEVVDPESNAHSVADFRRSPVTSLRGRFRPQMHEASGIDFVWFGIRSATPRAKQPQSKKDPAVPRLPPSPLERIEDGFAIETWLRDWSHWAVRWQTADQDAQPAGLVVDESLINGEILPENGSVEEALLVWRHLWNRDSQWLDSTSDDRLVHVRRCHRNSRTTFIFFNQAPWSMIVTLPLVNLVQWNSVVAIDSDISPSFASQLERLQLTRPTVSMLGSTVAIPPMGMVVCQTDQELARTLTFGHRIDGGAAKVAELTQNVTTIVEHLGLLGELASLTRNTSDHFAQQNKPLSASQNWIRPVSDSQSRQSQGSHSQPTKSSSWGAAIWSPDRWGLGRAVSGGEPTDVKQSGAQSVGGNAFTGQPIDTSTATDQLGMSRIAIDSDATGTAEANLPSCRNLLSNGGFEAESSMGIPGWMHSQHPADAVALDRRIKHSGASAIRMAGKDARGSTTWLISRDLCPPVTGRLGVSMTFRREPSLAESADNAQAVKPQDPEHPAGEPSTIRIAIEGERDGLPIRQAVKINVPPDGQWQPGIIALQWLDLDSQRDTNLRLTIDNFSSSVIWIDDVVVTDYYASQAERTDLQSLAYLAVSGLQHSDLAPTARLLNNFWAGELLRVARFTPVSLLRGEANYINEAINPDDESAATKEGRFFESPTLPARVWGQGEGTTGPVSSSRQSEEAPNNRYLSRPEDARETEALAEEPISISRRIRGWLPSPLRF